MVTALALLGVLAVLFAAAVLSTREQDLLTPVGPDDADVALPTEPLTPEDVRGVRLSLAPRGYRMSQVDEVLERLAQELTDRDRRIGLLEEAAAPAAPAPAAPAPAAPAVEAESLEATPAPERVVETIHVPPTPTTLAWSNPAAVPEFPVIDAPEADVRRDPDPAPDPLPPADLGTELVQGERRDEAAGGAEVDRQR